MITPIISNRAAASVVYVTSTPTGSADTGSKSTNVAGIIAGVVVGVVVIGAAFGGLFFWMRQKRNREIEEEHRRNAAVNAFMGGKPPNSSGGYSMEADTRLDPVMAQRRLSSGSIADNQDYSRPILRVCSPHPTSIAHETKTNKQLCRSPMRENTTRLRRTTLACTLLSHRHPSAFVEFAHVLGGSTTRRIWRFIFYFWCRQSNVSSHHHEGLTHLLPGNRRLLPVPSSPLQKLSTFLPVCPRGTSRTMSPANRRRSLRREYPIFLSPRLAL